MITYMGYNIVIEEINGEVEYHIYRGNDFIRAEYSEFGAKGIIDHLIEGTKYV